MTKSKSMLNQAEEFLAFRRQLGSKLRADGYLLREFGRYADKVGHKGAITAEIAFRWVRWPPKATPNYLARRFQVICGFARHQASIDPKTEIPTAAGLKLRRIQPHIYTEQQITNLLAAAAALSPSDGLRPRTYHTLFGLLASTGMRVGEAIRLQRDDVNLEQGILRISNAKFSKSRHVPVHSSTLQVLRHYAEFRDRYHPAPESAMFLLSECGTPLNGDTVRGTFEQLRERLGWACSIDGRAPRIHDLRHTFACRRLLQWYREKIDVDHAILALSTYLGHSAIACTYWYLTGIPELFAICADRFQQFAGTKLGGVS